MDPRSVNPPSAEERRLVALAAVFAPRRAVDLLRMLAGVDVDRILDEAARAATLPRRDRLVALERWAATRVPRHVRRAQVEEIAAAERPTAASVLRAMQAGFEARRGGPPAHRLLERMLTQRLDEVGARPEVRPATAGRPPEAAHPGTYLRHDP